MENSILEIKQIIRCPRCEYEDGQIQSLAELLPSGIISIRRSRKTYTGEHETTLILGNNFELLCGRCQTPVFRKQMQTIQLGTLIITQQQLQATFGTI